MSRSPLRVHRTDGAAATVAETAATTGTAAAAEADSIAWRRRSRDPQQISGACRERRSAFLCLSFRLAKLATGRGAACWRRPMPCARCIVRTRSSSMSSPPQSSAFFPTSSFPPPPLFVIISRPIWSEKLRRCLATRAYDPPASFALLTMRRLIGAPLERH